MRKIDRYDIGLLLIRGIVGVVFAFHGSQKLFGWFGGYGITGTAGFFAKTGIPLPTLSTWLAALTETFGGVLLVLGLATRLITWPMAFTMAVAIATVHYAAFSSAAGGMEFPLTLGLTLLGLAFTGAGRLSLDGLIAHARTTRRARPTRSVTATPATA